MAGAQDDAVETFVMLVNWTEDGIKGVQNSVQRFNAAKQVFEAHGGEFAQVLWTQGQFDMVALGTASKGTISSFGLALGSLGHVRTVTLRAFTEAEFTAILAEAHIHADEIAHIHA